MTDGGEVFVGGRVAGEVRFGDAVWPAENVAGFVARFDREGASRDRRMFASPSADEVRDLRVERAALVVVGVGGALRLATERTRRDDTLDGFVYRASVAAFGAAPGPSLARVTADEPGGDLPARPLPARPDEAGSRIRIALTSEDESYANAPFHVEAEGWSFEGTISAQGVVTEWRANPLWVRLDRDVHEEFGVQRLHLVSRGERRPIAGFLSPDEKESFGAALQAALTAARRGPNRTALA